MKQGIKLILSLIFIFSLVLFGGTLSFSIDSDNEQILKVVCEDAEDYVIFEKAVLETSQVPKVNGDLIIIDARRLSLTLYRDGQPIKKYPIAIGTPKTPSPIGEWKIINKGGNWGGGFGVRWMGLNVPWGIYGIHGTNKPGSIGHASSHGCIRMFNHNVLELYSLVKVGTSVHIVGDLPRVTIPKEVKRKQVGKDVLVLQFALRKAGFDPGPADARFGPGMEEAVLKLQQFYGLEPSGIIRLNEQYLIKVR